MQYKIPIQIENEDPIFLGLSLRQLAIIMIGWGIGYSLFTSLAPSFWVEIALLPSWLIFWIAVTIAVFKYSEMTFMQFILAFIRQVVNMTERKWIKWVDSFQPIDIWYITSTSAKKEEKVDMSNKIDKIKEMEEKLNKI